MNRFLGRAWLGIHLLSPLSLGLAGASLAACAPESAPIDVDVEEETFAGRADDAQTFLAVVRHGTDFMIYACDDEHDAWFRASSLVSPMELENAAGDRVLVALDGDVARGAITFTGLAERPFTLDVTDDEVLFRADESIGGERVVGGWIRLPDGEQRGIVTRATSRAPSRINPDLTSDILPARLTPAPFTPQALARVTLTRLARFDLYGLGDSYGAGEGAPDVAGDYEDDGDLEPDGSPEVWNSSLTDPVAIREARACHRSGGSGIEVASDLLAADYVGAVDLRLTPLACSGAQTEHLLNCPYRGAIGDHFEGPSDLQPAQIGRMATLSRAAGIDAVYMSIGGNDMRFGFLLSDCVRDGTVPGTQCGPESEVATEFFEAVSRMPTQYRMIADRLTALGVPSQSVYFARAPNPLLDEDGEACDELDLFDFAGLLRVDEENTHWLATEIVPAMDRAFVDGAAANRWTLVSEHANTFIGHGYCTSDPWFIDNPTSLRTQGRSMTDALNDSDFPLDECIAVPETYETVGPVAPATVGGSIAHPTRDGYRLGYGPAIAESMRAQVEEHIRPTPVAGLRIQAQARLGGVTLAWDDLASTETEYRVRLTYAEGAGLPATETLTLPRDSRLASIPLSVRARGTAAVSPCYVGPAPARRVVCGAERSIAFTNFAPTTLVMDARVDTSRAATVSARDLLDGFVNHQDVRVMWTASSEPGVVFYDVELTDSAGVVRRLATTSSSMLVDPTVSSARVRSCNFVGCTEPSRVAVGPGCATNQIVNASGACVANTSTRSVPLRDLACAGVGIDPAGICRR